MTDEIIAFLVDDGPSRESNSLKLMMLEESAVKRQRGDDIGETLREITYDTYLVQRS